MNIQCSFPSEYDKLITSQKLITESKPETNSYTGKLSLKRKSEKKTASIGQ